MKSIQSIVLAAIVLSMSACSSNAVKQSPAASLPGTQSAAEAPVAASVEVSSATAIHSVEGPVPQSEKPAQIAGRKVSGARQPSDADQIINREWTPALVGASTAPTDEPTADVNRPTGAEEDAAMLYSTEINDPWERYNRVMYKFNMKVVDKYIARPIGMAYDAVVPDVVQRRFTSFFANLQEPRTLVNQLLQGRPVGAAKTLGRFVVNTTAGIGGTFDPASKIELNHANEDLGQTLAVWGWDHSRYFIAPLQGPKTMRDFVSGFGDKPLNPLGYIDNEGVSMAITILRLGSLRSAAFPMDKLRAEAFDEYAFVRDAWMQRRKSQIETK